MWGSVSAAKVRELGDWKKFKAFRPVEESILSNLSRPALEIQGLSALAGRSVGKW